jgi:hypothetical protein
VKSTQATTLERDKQIVLGIDEEMPVLMDLHLRGQAFTPASLTTLIQQRIDAANELFTARARLQGAIRNYAAIDRRVKPLVVDLRTLVLALFGAKGAARFGFSPNKVRRKLTVQEKLAKAAKCRETRRARGTLGSVQRAALAATAAR